MSIVVNPHNQQEEKELLAFLDRMKFDYVKANDAINLSAAQQQEIVERDRQYESGEVEIFTLDQIIDYFDLKK